MKFITHSIFIVTILFLSAILFSAGFLFWLSSHDWLDLTIISQKNRDLPTIVFDDAGNELFKFSCNYHEPVIFGKIPVCVIHAFLAAEDHNFFKHSGISIRGIIRSLWINLRTLRFAQGASTITQQLIKLIYTDGSRTFRRKIKEQILALILEQRYSKEQIFQAYVNNIYFGCGIYGITAASRIFFNKAVEELTIDQAALLAGIVKSPGNYCPLINSQAAQERRNIVLNCMFRQQYITHAQAQECIKKNVATLEKTPERFLYLREMLRNELEKILGKNALYTQGYRVYTTINLHDQLHAERIFKHYIEQFRNNFSQPINGALVSIDGKTGGIKILIGGYSFQESQFNRCFAKRQMGSVFKPLVYTAALEMGIPLTRVEIDEPFTLNQGQVWSPHNVHKKFDGPMTLAYALSHSNNIVSIKTLLNIGAEKVLELAHRCHLQVPEYGYPALALGCLDATPLQVVSMFNIFAQAGYYYENYLIESIKDRFGHKIFKHQPSCKQLISWQHASQINRVLQLAMDSIRQRNPQLLSNVTIGKTGTATQATSCWFAGATPERTMVIYMGRDDNKPMGSNVYGMKTTLPLWLDVNAKISCQQKEFKIHSQLTEIMVDAFNGERVSLQHPHALPLLISQ